LLRDRVGYQPEDGITEVGYRNGVVAGFARGRIRLRGTGQRFFLVNTTFFEQDGEKRNDSKPLKLSKDEVNRI